MALKELVDNALDQGGGATLERIDPDTWCVRDDGSGLEPDQIARLFAVNRPLTSSKLLRRPTRGAVGNGLRVVTGAAIASGGTLHVESRGHRFRIDVNHITGATNAVNVGCNGSCSLGTKVTICFGPALARSQDDGRFAHAALRFPGHTCEPFRSHLG